MSDTNQLFRFISEEVCRDGVIDSDENKVLNKIGFALGLSSRQAIAIVRQSVEAFRSGKLGTARPMNGYLVYQDLIVSLVSRYGSFLPESSLGSIRRALGVNNSYHLHVVEHALQSHHDCDALEIPPSW